MQSDNSLVFDAYFRCDVGGNQCLRDVGTAIRFRISELFGENDIIIALLQRDVHLYASEPLEIRLIGEETSAWKNVRK